MDSKYHSYALEGECESFDDIKENVEQFRMTVAQRDEELKQMLEEMAPTIAGYEDQLEQLSCLRTEENKGKTVEDVSPRQA